MNVASNVTPRDLEEEQYAALQRMTPVQRPILRLVVGVGVWVLLATTCLGDGARWRKLVLLTLALTVVVLGVVGRARRRRLGPRPIRITGTAQTLMGLCATLMMGGLVMATGGFDGPVLPMLIPLCFVIGTLNRPRALMGFAAMTVFYVWATALLSAHALIPNLMPAIFGGGPNVPQSHVLLYARAGSLTLMVVWAASASHFVRKLFHGMVGDALDARDEALRIHADHTRALIALSGEIAHELKNPLASIKGLANLVAREVTGKPGERMAVLRREVDRMEEILKGFLNFSRPLLPLDHELVSMTGLCEAVVALHEGLARERGVELRIDDDRPLRVSCDRRKVKQVLINLTQNALDASPPGSTIALVLRPRGAAGAVIEVQDRGSGLSEAVRSRLFEPGATTKDEGSGLGLALARGLARQHGGELELHDREGGGCAAVLTLPGTPPP